MCSEHTSKRKCWPGANKCGASRKVCQEDEQRVLKKGRVMILVYTGIVLLIICVNLSIRQYHHGASEKWQSD